MNEYILNQGSLLVEFLREKDVHHSNSSSITATNTLYQGKIQFSQCFCYHTIHEKKKKRPMLTDLELHLTLKSCWGGDSISSFCCSCLLPRSSCMNEARGSWYPLKDKMVNILLWSQFLYLLIRWKIYLISINNLWVFLCRGYGTHYVFINFKDSISNSLTNKAF